MRIVFTGSGKIAQFDNSTTPIVSDRYYLYTRTANRVFVCWFAVNGFTVRLADGHYLIECLRRYR